MEREDGDAEMKRLYGPEAMLIGPMQGPGPSSVYRAYRRAGECIGQGSTVEEALRRAKGPETF